LKIREKVFAYITKGGQLLVFAERGFESFGLQIPAGTPEEAESLELAVQREAGEETGLESLTFVGCLGSVMVDQSEYGTDEVHQRHFYHLICEEETPESWSHIESDPSTVQEDTPETIVYDIRWSPLSDRTLELAPGHGVFLDLLRERLGF
jgi:8-oxo-dGTP pyrophosphatase MutT (NUDIX family)